MTTARTDSSTAAWVNAARVASLSAESNELKAAGRLKVRVRTPLSSLTSNGSVAGACPSGWALSVIIDSLWVRLSPAWSLMVAGIRAPAVGAAPDMGENRATTDVVDRRTGTTVRYG